MQGFPDGNRFDLFFCEEHDCMQMPLAPECILEAEPIAAPGEGITPFSDFWLICHYYIVKIWN
jgi:hypothetical protein